MKHFIMLLAIVSMALSVSCSKEAADAPKVTFEVTSGVEYKVDANGGDIYVAYISEDDVTTTIVSGNEAIKEIKNPAKGILVVTFKANTTGAMRTAVVELRTPKDFTTLVFLQASGTVSGNADVNFAASSMDGYYYGEKYGEGSD